MKRTAFHGPRRLAVFISSTADLKEERHAVCEALDDIDVDGTGFESWPSSPNPPLDECLRHIEESEAMVLLLGRRYGRIGSGGISATHAEYRHAKRCGMPIFPFVLKVASREPEEVAFLDEVQQGHFHAPEVESTAQLREWVRRSFLLHFTRCFRDVHSRPPNRVMPMSVDEGPSPIAVPRDKVTALRVLMELYQHGHDAWIHSSKEQWLAHYADDPDVRNVLYMVEVNRGINDQTFDQNMVESALPFWRSAYAKKHWQWYGLLYNQGNALTALKRYSEAAKKYREALRLHAKYPECWKNLGSAYLNLGKRDSARDCYEKALSQAPGLFEALYCLGVLLAQADEEPQRALAYMERIEVESLSPDHQAAVLSWRAHLCLRIGRYSDAVTNAEGAIQADADQTWAWLTAARVYAVVRRDDNKWLRPASGFWSRFVQRSPEDKQAWSEFGFTLWFLRDNTASQTESQAIAERALDAFQKAIGLGADGQGLIWDKIGHLHQELGDLPEAERAFGEAVSRSRPQFLCCLANCLFAQGRFEDALPLALESAQQYQPDARGWGQVGKCYLNLRMFDEAESAFNKAIELDPEYDHPWFDLGGLYWNQGLCAEAVAIWKEAHRRFPDFPLPPPVRKLLGL